MIEQNLINLAFGNLTGVVFGLLMYKMADGSIKEHTKAIKELIIEIRTNKK